MLARSTQHASLGPAPEQLLVLATLTLARKFIMNSCDVTQSCFGLIPVFESLSHCSLSAGGLVTCLCPPLAESIVQ